MTQADQERLRALTLPPGNVVSVLLEQHAKIRDLFVLTTGSLGEERQRAFDELRELLAVHEAGEEIVVRPVSTNAAGREVADARNAEERQAAFALAELEKLDVGSAEFARGLATLEGDISEHAGHEESAEFPYVLATVDAEEQLKMGERLLNVQTAAPSHPHPTVAGSPTAQVVIGPFAALLDRARDAFARAHEGADDG